MAESVNELPSPDPRSLLLMEAALRVFARYGVKRATMADVASEAGVTRQTVYNRFSNKETLVRAVVRGFAERQLEAARAAVEEQTPLGEALQRYLRHLFLTPHEMLRGSPHAEDILSGFNEFAKSEIEATAADAQLAISELFVGHEAELGLLGMTAVEMAQLVHTAARGIKLKATGPEQAEQMLMALTRTVVAALDR